MIKLRIIIALALLLGFSHSVQAQTITVPNPSFEGPASSSTSPPGWSACGGSPDTQPPWWGVSLGASHLSTYYGLVYLQSIPTSQESGSALLSTPLIAGTQHNFSVDLVNLQVYNGSWNGNCIARLWGGSSCGFSEVLWTSPQLTNSTWNNFNVSFTPSSAHTHITWQVVIGTGTFSSLGVDNMSPITTTVLDIEVTDFQASRLGKGVELSWNASGSGEKPRFVVERSKNGLDFESIGEINPDRGIDGLVSHSFVDELPIAGKSFYRLHTIDQNGQSYLSATRPIFNPGESGLGLGDFRPNPANGRVSISIQAEEDRMVRLRFFDLMGREVWSKHSRLKQGVNEVEMDIAGFEPGVYIFRAGNCQASGKLIVE